MFATDDQLKSYLKDVMAKQPAAALLPHWDQIVTRSNISAYNDIVSRFARRGYSKAQIDRWDRGLEYQLDIGVWYCLQKLATMQPEYHTQSLQWFDRRMEISGNEIQGLTLEPLIVNGEIVTPDKKYGQVSTGEFDATSDLFVPHDLTDPRRGVTTRF